MSSPTPVTGIACPMCGAPIGISTVTCPGCGETLTPAATDELTTPLHSLKLIGWCTLLYSFPAGILLLVLNCRRLGLYVEARRAAVEGAMWLFVLVVVSLFIPDDALAVVILVIAQLVVINRLGRRLLGPQFVMLRSQGGPYASTWTAHGLGLLMLTAWISVLIGYITEFE
jgi:hypothetical protein